MIDLRFENKNGINEKVLVGMNASLDEIKTKCNEVFKRAKYGFINICCNGFCEKVAVMVNREMVIVEYEAKC